MFIQPDGRKRKPGDKRSPHLSFRGLIVGSDFIQRSGGWMDKEYLEASAEALREVEQEVRDRWGRLERGEMSYRDDEPYLNNGLKTDEV